MRSAWGGCGDSGAARGGKRFFPPCDAGESPISACVLWHFSNGN